MVYQLTSQEWKRMYLTGIAISGSFRPNMLVVCERKPYVYEHPFGTYKYPCHYEEIMETKKYKIKGKEVNPQCIVANANTAFVSMLPYDTSRLVRFSLPKFTSQSNVYVNFNPRDLSISANYLLVMGPKKMVVKRLGDVSQTLSQIESPDGWEFLSVFSEDTTIYVACYQDGNMEKEKGKGLIYKYTWNGQGTPNYTNVGYNVIDDFGFKVAHGCLSVTNDYLLAISECGRDATKIYQL